jgi:hypothetical protein
LRFQEEAKKEKADALAAEVQTKLNITPTASAADAVSAAPNTDSVKKSDDVRPVSDGKPRSDRNKRGDGNFEGKGSRDVQVRDKNNRSDEGRVKKERIESKVDGRSKGRSENKDRQQSTDSKSNSSKRDAKPKAQISTTEEPATTVAAAQVKHDLNSCMGL